jgi:hypothetical protein
MLHLPPKRPSLPCFHNFKATGIPELITVVGSQLDNTILQLIWDVLIPRAIIFRLRDSIILGRNRLF